MICIKEALLYALFRPSESLIYPRTRLNKQKNYLKGLLQRQVFLKIFQDPPLVSFPAAKILFAERSYQNLNKLMPSVAPASTYRGERNQKRK